MRNHRLKLVCTSLLVGGLVACDSSTHSHQEHRIVEDSSSLPDFHSLDLVESRRWIDGAPPIAFCNGIDSVTGQTTYFTFWGLLGDRHIGQWAFAWYSNDTASLLLFPERSNDTETDSSRILPMQFVYALDSFPSTIKFLTFRPSPSAKRLSSADSARGYLDFSMLTTIPRVSCKSE